MKITFRTIREAQPGKRWLDLFTRYWPSYREWFFSGTNDSTPRVVAEKRLRHAMPELLPTYRKLVELAGGGTEAARFLTLYRPAPYLTGCSQAVWTGEEPVLVRNYDYTPRLWEGVLLSTSWTGRRVIAMGDCLWGALDGMNEAGLAVSLAFGGRRVVGDGFGCPLILRYVLEMCETTKQAAEVLRSIPTHMAYNITLIDASGDYLTAYLSPDKDPVLRRWPLATNHQEEGAWRQYIEMTASIERERQLADRLGDPRETLDDLIGAFLKPPLRSTAFAQASGTLYTSIYYPVRRSMEVRWPGRTLAFSIGGKFPEKELSLDLAS